MLVRVDVPVPHETFPTRAAAWDYLRHLISLIVSLFGSPSHLASLGGVSLDFRADANFWLRAAERLARLLLLAEAADIAPLKRQPRPRPRRYVFPRTDLSAKESEKWRVSFPVLRANRKCGSGAKGYSIPCTSPMRLAARIEALARVVLDPRPHALRLARRLDRRPNSRAVRALLAPVSTEGEPLLRVVEMFEPFLGRVRARFSSA